ncbi:TRAP transporter substrate-binding protein [Microbacterium sp. HA-8]|uniref:TRAP transporter substrate-binding protein n=1 Tax=Microbacterium sp. HA-8 TaxID=3234200 RepID=UPI0038F5E1D0
MKKTTARGLPIIAVSAALVLSGCAGGAGEGEGAPAEGETLTLTLGHAGSEEDTRQIASLRFEELVEEMSGGDIQVEVYPSATLGTWEEMIEGLQLGTTDVVVESLLSLETYTDLAGIETAPFLYEDEEQFFEVWDGELGAEIKGAIAEASGYDALGNMYRGARQLTTKEAVETIDDVQGLTIRTPSAATMMATWDALGARAEALAFNEVYSALESGVIDGQENPLDTILHNSFAEVAPYIAETSHVYANYHFLMWEDTLAGYPEEYQDIIREAAQQVGEEYTAATIESEAEYRQELTDGGATFTELTDREAWVDATQPVIDSFPEQVKEWVSQIRG